MIGNGNVLKPRLPLVGVPGMFLQDCYHLVDGRRVLLLKDLVSDDSREYVAGDVPCPSGKRRQGQRQSAREAMSATVASYVISDEQGAGALQNKATGTLNTAIGITMSLQF
jgi:hypothetical protein